MGWFGVDWIRDEGSPDTPEVDQDKELANKLLERLKERSQDEWLFIGWKFNHWEFPLSFYDLIPSWWNPHCERGGKVFDWKRHSAVMQPMSQLIDKTFSRKDQLHFHNVKMREAMTPSEFEYWWGLSNEDQTEYHGRSMKIEQLEWWRDDIFQLVSDIIDKQHDKTPIGGIKSLNQ